MVLGIQIIGIIFSLSLIYVTYVNLKKGAFTINEFLFWNFISIIIIVLATFPEILDPIVKTLNFSRTLDFVVIVGFLFLTAGLMYIYLVTRSTMRKVEKLVINLTLKEQELKNKRNKPT